jgi:glycosyltransferase involved in cell wall biosynthesis
MTTVKPEPGAGLPATARESHSTGLCLTILVGGYLAERGEQVASGARPRIDVFELQRRFAAPVLDLDTLRGPGARARALNMLARVTGRRSLALALRCLNRIRQEDAVYVTGEDVGFPLAILMRLFRVLRPRLVLRLEQPTYGRSRLRRALFDFYMRRALPRIDRVLCRTEAHVRYLNERFRVPLERLSFVPETTDAAFFSPGDSLAPEREWPQHTCIVSAGLELRDYGTLAEAVRGLPVSVVIAAGSPWSHERYANSKALPANVTVASYDPLEMRELYRSASFVVVPVKPTMRACGMNVVLEAWATGKAVIATRTEGMAAYLENEETALLVEPADADDLRAKIARLLNFPAEARRLGANGRARVEAELNIDCYIEAVGEAIDSALATRR